MRKTAAGKRPPRARRRNDLPWILLVVLGAIATGAWWLMREPRVGPQNLVPAEAPWGNAALAMGPVEAYSTGVALADSGHARASLPYLHHSVMTPGAPWQAWRLYAAALHNVAMTGTADPWTTIEIAPRSSFERVALMRQALRHIKRAISLSGTPPEGAIAQLTRGQFLRTWGHGWDALQDFHQAGELDPQWRNQGDLYARLMRDPQQPVLLP